MALEVVCNAFGGIDHVFHKFASGNTPLLTGSPGVQLLLTCVRVGQPMEMFLFEPPKPPIVWPLK